MLMRKQLSPPEFCDNCKGVNFKLIVNSLMYGIERGEWPYGYYCFTCKSYVGCHSGTHNPMGRMATGSTRRKRTKLHQLFDIVWQENWLRRSDAYRWLGTQLNLSEPDECHIAELSKEDLEKAITLMKSHQANNYAMFKRRCEKAKVKRSEQRNRANAKIGRRKFG